MEVVAMPKFWQIRTTPNTPATKRKIKAYAAKRNMTVGQALDEIARNLR